MHPSKSILGLLVLALEAVSLPALAQATDPAAAPTAAAEPAPPPAPAAAPAPAPTYAAPAPAAPVEPGSIRDISLHSRPLALSVMAYVPWWYGLGIGAKVGVEIPVAPNGFIPSINDQFSLEPTFSFASIDYGYAGINNADTDNVIELVPALAAMWSFHLSQDFRVYGEASFGYGIFTGDVYNNVSINYFHYELAAGLFYKLSDAFALRAEVGWRALRGGIAILL